MFTPLYHLGDAVAVREILGTIACTIHVLYREDICCSINVAGRVEVLRSDGAPC